MPGNPGALDKVRVIKVQPRASTMIFQAYLAIIKCGSKKGHREGKRHNPQPIGCLVHRLFFELLGGVDAAPAILY
jgi:hypothetical protein